jgi:hypothetical protein
MPTPSPGSRPLGEVRLSTDRTITLVDLDADAAERAVRRLGPVVEDARAGSG